MKQLMTRTILAAAIFAPMTTFATRANLIAAPVAETTSDNEPVKVQVETVDIAGPEKGVMTIVPGGHGQDVLRITGDGQPMRTMMFVNANQKTEKGTFLGVTTSAVPAALRAQMSLPKGFGLTVETIEKDSPAEKAGVEKYDILQKLNDQLLVNQQQLQVLVRSMKPGESVAITLLRKGQPTTVNATLVEKDVPELADNDVMGGGGGIFTPGFAMPEIAKWEGNADPMSVLRELKINGHEASNIVSTDGEQTLELTSKNGGKQLVVKDKDDKVLFDGPIDTPEQRQALPEGVAAKLEKLESKLHKITIRAKVHGTSEAPVVEEEKK